MQSPDRRSGHDDIAYMIQTDHEDAPDGRKVQGLLDRSQRGKTDPSDRVKTSGPNPFPKTFEWIARHADLKKGVNEG